MHIALLYPPPWKITRHQPPDRTCGPPPGIDPRRLLQGDFLSLPQGLASLAIQARAAGHRVTLYNLSTFAWDDVATIIRGTPADLFGLSCFTANRRGALALADLIRTHHPRAHICMGGPHATALPAELLRYCAAVDSIVVGEGEGTFAELLARLAAGTPVAGLAGTISRHRDSITAGPARPRINRLDELPSPAAQFGDYIVMTARGCPWDCSFCASSNIWGRLCRSHSTAHTLAVLADLSATHGLRAIAFKDETFTLQRERVLALCAGIRARRLPLLWSCDTRADTLDPELLGEMRRAGCQRISLGVESGAPAILQRLNKQLDLNAVRQATRQARAVGLQVRFYMIAGAPGETDRTLEQSIAFVRDCAPSEVIWNPYTLLPGTPAFAQACAAGTADSGLFFQDDCFEHLPLCADAGTVRAFLAAHQGLQPVGGLNLAACRAVVDRLPDVPAAHMDCAAALAGAHKFAEAERYIAIARDLGYPLPGLIENLQAGIAARRNDLRAAIEHLIAARAAGTHAVVERNIAQLQHWIRTRGPRQGPLPDLDLSLRFEISRPRRQPLTPGPITLDAHEPLMACY